MPNKILEAFMRGVSEKNDKERQAEQLKLEKERAKAQQEQFQQQLDAVAAQHEIENKQHEAAFQAAQSFNTLKQQQEIQEHYAKYGLAPGNSTVSEPSFSVPRAEPMESGLGIGPVNMPIPTDLSNIPSEHAIVHYLGQDIPVVSPTGTAQQQAKSLDITQGPLIERAARAEADKAKAAQELEKLKIKANSELRRQQDDAAYKRTIDAARIRADATKSSSEKDQDKLLSPDEAERFGVQYGAKRSDVFGKNAGIKLTPAQEEKITVLDGLEKKAMEIQDLMDTPEGKSFFKGPKNGLYEEGRRALSSKRNANYEKLRSKLGEIEATIAKARAGTSFTPNEQKLLETYVTKPSHMGVYETAKPQIESLIKNTRDLRAETLANISGRIIKPSSSSSSSEDHLYFDKNGNVIPKPKGEK